MRNKTLVLWWYDINWKKKGEAKHLVCAIDYAESLFRVKETCVIPQGLNCIEVKRKSDLTDYIATLKKIGFLEEQII